MYSLNKDAKFSLIQYQLKSKHQFLPVAKNVQAYKAADLHDKYHRDEKEKKTYYQSAKFIIKMNQLPAVSLQMTISEETALSISSYTDSPKLISQAGSKNLPTLSLKLPMIVYNYSLKSHHRTQLHFGFADPQITS